MIYTILNNLNFFCTFLFSKQSFKLKKYPEYYFCESYSIIYKMNLTNCLNFVSKGEFLDTILLQNILHQL